MISVNGEAHNRHGKSMALTAGRDGRQGQDRLGEVNSVKTYDFDGIA